MSRFTDTLAAYQADVARQLAQYQTGNLEGLTLPEQGNSDNWYYGSEVPVPQFDNPTAFTQYMFNHGFNSETAEMHNPRFSNIADQTALQQWSKQYGPSASSWTPIGSYRGSNWYDTGRDAAPIYAGYDLAAGTEGSNGGIGIGSKLSGFITDTPVPWLASIAASGGAGALPALGSFVSNVGGLSGNSALSTIGQLIGGASAASNFLNGAGGVAGGISGDAPIYDFGDVPGGVDAPVYDYSSVPGGSDAPVFDYDTPPTPPTDEFGNRIDNSGATPATPTDVANQTASSQTGPLDRLINNVSNNPIGSARTGLGLIQLLSNLGSGDTSGAPSSTSQGGSTTTTTLNPSGFQFGRNFSMPNVDEHYGERMSGESTFFTPRTTAAKRGGLMRMQYDEGGPVDFDAFQMDVPYNPQSEYYYENNEQFGPPAPVQQPSRDFDWPSRGMAAGPGAEPDFFDKIKGGVGKMADWVGNNKMKSLIIAMTLASAMSRMRQANNQPTASTPQPQKPNLWQAAQPLGRQARPLANMSSYYTYGQGPEQLQFNNVNPGNFMSQAGRGYAEGGDVEMEEMSGAPMGGMAQMERGDEPGPVEGPGDGTSDSVPAMLSKDEYVWDAQVVSALGNGSSEAGAKILDEARKKIMMHKFGKKGFPPDAKPLESYLGES